MAVGFCVLAEMEDVCLLLGLVHVGLCFHSFSIAQTMGENQ